MPGASSKTGAGELAAANQALESEIAAHVKTEAAPARKRGPLPHYGR